MRGSGGEGRTVGSENWKKRATAREISQKINKQTNKRIQNQARELIRHKYFFACDYDATRS